MTRRLLRAQFARVTDRGLRATLGSLAAGASLQLTLAASGIFAARLLGVTDRGHLALMWVVTVVTAQLSTLGLHVAIVYAVASGVPPGTVIHRLRYVIATQLLVATLLALLIDWALFHDVPRVGWGALAALAVVPSAFVLLLYGLAVVQGQHRYASVQLHRLAQPLVYVLVLVVLAATGHGHLRQVTIGWSVTMVFGGLFAWRQGLGSWRPTRREAALEHELARPRTLLSFSFRSLFSAFGFVEHLQADQLLTGLLLSASQFGLYAAGSAFANLPEFLGQSIGYVAYPEVSREAPARKRRTVLRFVVIAVVVITPIAGVLVAVVPWLLPRLFGHSFRPAVPVAQLILAAALIQAFRRVAAEGLRGLGSGMSATVAELTFAAVFVCTLIPLAQHSHAKGAALALLLASIAAAGTLLTLSSRTLSRSDGAQGAAQPGELHEPASTVLTAPAPSAGTDHVGP